MRIFNSRSFLTKENVIDDINIQLTELEVMVEYAVGEQFLYLKTKYGFLQEFINRINRTVVFNKLEPWWAYRYVLSSRGVSLELVHVNCDNRHFTVLSEGNDYFSILDTVFTVVQHEAKTMLIVEYAKYTEKTEASIRQALRRGKYRSAFKMGQEWRISELCQPSVERGYNHGEYEWNTTLYGIPKDYEYIKDPGFIWVDQEADEQSFEIYVYSYEKNRGNYYHLNKVETERLERFLIANPMVFVKDDEKVFDRRSTSGKSK